MTAFARTLFWGRPSNPWARFGPAVAWAVLIFILSSIPGDKYPEVDVPNADKWVHAVLYFPVGWLFARAACCTREAGRPEWIVALFAAVLTGVAFGYSDEVHQLWVPNRSYDLLDFAVDSIGVFLGSGAWALRSVRFRLSGPTSGDTTSAP